MNEELIKCRCTHCKKEINSFRVRKNTINSTGEPNIFVKCKNCKKIIAISIDNTCKMC